MRRPSSAATERGSSNTSTFSPTGRRRSGKLQQKYFPDAEVALDWYHVAEKLWSGAKCIHRKDRQARAAWVKRQQQRLRKGSFDALMTSSRVALDIATGVVEGAVRHLVGIRFDGPGMRWGDRRERLLHLRCILINEQWDQFRDHLAAANDLRLPPKPLPAVPYDAKTKAAA